MAYLLYSNGIIEECKPKNLVFTEEELLNLFTEFSEIKSSRLITVLNTWCIYGSSLNPEPIDFNRIASDIIQTAIYSHTLYVHDSELDPNWNVTDNILYKGYDEFSIDIKREIDKTANNVFKEIQISNEYEETTNILPGFIPLGATEDKRILFGFDPKDQLEEFYENEEFYIFSQKVYKYISENKQEKEPFTIYSDKKAQVIVDSSNVKTFLNLMLEKFKSKEEYEICTNISKMIKRWPPKNKKIKTINATK